MKKTLIMLSLCFLFFGCNRDWGNPTSRNYPINGNYAKLEICGAFEVEVSDQVSDVVVTVGDLAHEKVLVKVTDGWLHIGFEPNTNYTGVAKAIIPASILYELKLSGASSLTGDLDGENVKIGLSGASIYRGNVSANIVHFDLSGASTFNGEIDAYKIFMNLSGASIATTNGTCHTLMEINLSGASRLNAANLDAPMVQGIMSGGSFADVTCCSSLNVELSGGSTLVYGIVSDGCLPVINCPSSGGSIVKPRS